MGPKFTLADKENRLKCRALYVSSPNEDLIGTNFNKAGINTVNLFWPQWNSNVENDDDDDDDDEWSKLCELKNWNKSLIVNLVSKYGRVVRTVESFFQDEWKEKDYFDMLDERLEKGFSADKFNNMLDNNMSYNYAPHHLVFVRPTSKTPTKCEFYIPTPHLEEIFDNQLFQFVNGPKDLLSKLTLKGSFDGVLFERLGHRVISQSGEEFNYSKFQFTKVKPPKNTRKNKNNPTPTAPNSIVKPLNVGSKVSFEKLTQATYYKTIESIEDDVYYSSVNPCFPCIDAVSKLGFFQYTIRADEHPMTIKSFNKVRAEFPDVKKFYYVLPLQSAATFNMVEEEFKRWGDDIDFFLIAI
eukprot:TRINITY_DN729_c0_g1_i10.p1 TRINITY_DN729_c0_g1~~TRINITY_DN729_c0_g1_i10.p1  ORF type:complete len:355 (+),score=80.87 TRINITY_DN729_c0_g1_i10:558-1622(+)